MNDPIPQPFLPSARALFCLITGAKIVKTLFIEGKKRRTNSRDARPKNGQSTVNCLHVYSTNPSSFSYCEILFIFLHFCFLKYNFWKVFCVLISHKIFYRKLVHVNLSYLRKIKRCVLNVVLSFLGSSIFYKLRFFFFSLLEDPWDFNRSILLK